MFKNFHKIKYNAGMTLVELLVVISIFVVVSSITIFDYGSFRSSVSIKNLADDIALSIRKAQSYAIGAHSLNASFFNGYGVHFTTATSTSNILTGSIKSFVIFNDLTPANKLYDIGSGACGSGNECNEILNIISADQIANIYLNDADLATPANPIPVGASIDISFMRPNPDAYFCYRMAGNISSSCDQTNQDISHVKIKVSNGLSGSNLKTQMITVWNTGQINVQ